MIIVETFGLYRGSWYKVVSEQNIPRTFIAETRADARDIELIVRAMEKLDIPLPRSASALLATIIREYATLLERNLPNVKRLKETDKAVARLIQKNFIQQGKQSRIRKLLVDQIKIENVVPVGIENEEVDDALRKSVKKMEKK